MQYRTLPESSWHYKLESERPNNLDLDRVNGLETGPNSDPDGAGHRARLAVFVWSG